MGRWALGRWARGSRAKSSGLASTSPRSSVNPRFEEALSEIRRGEVQNVSVTGHLLGPPEIEELCRALSCTGSVKALELDSNMIGHKGAVQLADTLARDNNINLVDLTDNGIGDAGATALAARLGGNFALRHLDLTRNTIKGDGGLALGRMLTVNSGIRQLTLSENMLGAEGARAIGLALPDNLSLQILDLRKCGLGPKGARFIAQGLSKHAVLTELSVGLNNVMDDGATEFAEMIRVNRSIRHFYLDDNGIEGFGAELMAEALSNNDCLETLWMVNNYLSSDVVAKFAWASAQSKALRCLGFAFADASVPQFVLEDLDQAFKIMAQRTLTRPLHGKLEDSLGNDTSWDDDLLAAAGERPNVWGRKLGASQHQVSVCGEVTGAAPLHCKLHDSLRFDASWDDEPPVAAGEGSNARGRGLGAAQDRVGVRGEVTGAAREERKQHVVASRELAGRGPGPGTWRGAAQDQGPGERGRSPGQRGAARDQDQGPGEAWQAAQIQGRGVAQDQVGVCEEAARSQQECGPSRSCSKRPPDLDDGVFFEELLETAVDFSPDLAGQAGST